MGSAPTTLETFAGRPSEGITNSTKSFSGFDVTSIDPVGAESYIADERLDLLADADGDVRYVFAPTATSFGFGGSFEDANTGEGLRLLLSNGETVDVLQDTGFFGFTSATAFTSFTIVGRTPNGDPLNGELFYLDDVRFATSSVPSVPGPLAALPFALMALKRRKRA